MPVLAGPRDLAVELLGLVEYHDAWRLQQRVHDEVLAGERPETLLLLEHPAVYTAGRRTLPAERPVDGTPVVEVDRGGKITWHGPGQLVGYPIVRLRDPKHTLEHVTRLETALVAVCAELGVGATTVAGRTGVWVVDDAGERKIAAIGVSVRHGVTMHGFALNCDADLAAFGRIVPCGIADAGVTSLAVELGRRVGVPDAVPLVVRHLAAAFAARPLHPEVAA